MLLFTEEEYLKAKFRDLLPCKCDVCGTITKRIKKHFFDKKKNNSKYDFCSHKCQAKIQNTKVSCVCLNCGKEFYRQKKELERSKNGNHFCSRSCMAYYNNSHKDYGYRRSKFEIYTEEILRNKFPNLEIIFNNSSVIGYELDIYIPSLKLAFEINGIFHYKPIFGEYKFQRTQEIDKAKLNECEVQGIQLIVIDISSISKFSEDIANSFIQDIITIVERNL